MNPVTVLVGLVTLAGGVGLAAMAAGWVARKLWGPDSEDPYEIDWDQVAVQERPRYGSCPGCGADEIDWCASDCRLIDRMDLR